MTESEKITINMSVVDLGKIDLLVEEGFYGNRTDFIRAAIRSQLGKHESAVESITVRKSFVLGVLSYNQHDLGRYLEEGTMVEIRVIGMLHLAKDVTPELALATIQTAMVRGTLRAPADVKAALEEAGRIR